MVESPPSADELTALGEDADLGIEPGWPLAEPGMPGVVAVPGLAIPGEAVPGVVVVPGFAGVVIAVPGFAGVVLAPGLIVPGAVAPGVFARGFVAPGAVVAALCASTGTTPIVESAHIAATIAAHLPCALVMTCLRGAARSRAPTGSAQRRCRDSDVVMAAMALQTRRPAVSAASPVGSRAGTSSTMSKATIGTLAARPCKRSSTCW